MENNHETNALQHHGVKGQKWGVRRYQNKDGSLTSLGEKRMKTGSGVDKKLREDLKDRRASRLLSTWKQRQDMKQDRLDRESNRAIERAKIKLAQQKAKDDSADQALNRKLIKEKLKQDKAAQKQLAKAAAKTQPDIPDDEYYELPDTPARQSASSNSGRKVAGAALAAVGTVALAAAAKKYGPGLMSKLKNIDWSKAGKAAKDVTDKRQDYSDFASAVFKEAQAVAPAMSSALASVGNIPLLAAPKEDK